MPTERGAERAGRAVTDSLCDFRDRKVLSTKKIFRDCHPPSEQVLHRRQAHSAAETLEERGARQRALLRQLEASGPIDVLVDNAGIGLFGAFEATPMETTREVFETNAFCVMAMTQAVLPQFRQRKSGTVVNVTSSATLAPMPLVAVYTASKTAIEGFTASLAHELAPFRIQVKLVEPGYAPTTRFTENGGERMRGLVPEPYAPFAQSIFEALTKSAEVTTEADVAQAVWRAANDLSGQLRFPAGADAVALAARAPS